MAVDADGVNTILPMKRLTADLSGRKKAYLKATGYGRKRPR
jgi:hypothetical protein